MGFTETLRGRIAHHRHQSGFNLIIKTVSTERGLVPVTEDRGTKRITRYYCFAIPGGGDVWIPERGVVFLDKKK